jgi:uncharacterized membrane protein
MNPVEQLDERRDQTPPPMKTRTAGSRLSAALALSLSLFGPVSAQWTITDLGLLGDADGNDSQAWSINNRGHVVGSGRILTPGSAAQLHVVLWADGRQRDLGVNASSSLTGAKLNDADVVAINDGTWKPHVWQHGLLSVLPLLPGASYGGIHGLNSGGQIVGWSDSPAGGRSVIWHGGTVTDTGMMGGSFMWAMAINDSGTLAINRAVRGFNSYLVVAGTTNFLTVASVTPDGTTSVVDLNNAGQACGNFNNHVGQSAAWHACLWTGGDGIPLPEFPSGGSEAFGMNNLGHVVGYAYRGPYDAPAVLWRDGAFVNLSELPEVLAAGWSSLSARDVNDSDQVVGHGYHNGKLRAFLLSPATVPVPFHVTLRREATGATLSFVSSAGARYQVLTTTHLTATNWDSLGDPIPGSGQVIATHIPSSPETARFFVVRTVP